MASGNRVEELENRVKELEATVSGLTDELVETKERLRTLEEEVDPDVESGSDIIAPEPASAGTGTEPDSTSRTETAETSNPSAEDDKPTESKEENNSDSERDDDIIVA